MPADETAPLASGAAAAPLLTLARARGSSTPTSPARSWPAASRSPRSTGSASARTTRPPLGAGGALLRYLAELQPGGLPHLARPVVRRSDALPLARRHDPAKPGAGRAAPRRRARAAPCWRRSTRPSRRWAAGCCASGCSPRSAIRRRSRRGSTRWTSRCATAAAAPGCARRSTASATSSGSPAAPRRAARCRASWARCATPSSGSPTSPRR